MAAFRPILITAVVLSLVLQTSVFAGVGLGVMCEARTDGDFFLCGNAFLSHRYKFGTGSIFFTFGARPYGRKRFFEISPIEYDQLKEKRQLFLLGLDNSFQITSVVGLYGKAGFGYSGGSYHGTSRNAPEGWFPLVGGGLHFSSRSTEDPQHVWASVRLGYEYKEIFMDSPHGIIFSLGLNLF